MQLYLASFVFIFNLCLFVLHYDVMNVLFDTICTLQTYRAIGLMGSTMLPEAVLMLYSKLGLIALDYEFGQPGCEGTQSDFVSIYRMNLMLLVVSASPVFVIMPLLAQLGALVEKERNSDALVVRLLTRVFPGITPEWGGMLRLKWKDVGNISKAL